MAITVAPTQSNVQTALRSFLASVLPPGTEVIEGQDNRIPEPAGPDFVVMTAIRRRRISTNVDAQVDANNETLLQATEIAFQLDVHGPNSADNAEIVSTTFRDDFAVQSFAGSGFDVAPLHADDPRQVPFINAEQQFETRWIVEALVQANQVVTVAQDSANAASVNTINVDAAYPPH